MKRIITLIVILFFGSQLSGTYTEESRWVVTGVVRDNLGNPLPGAAILVKDTFIGVYSDLEGKFIIKSLKDGDYTLKISFLGYKTAEKDISLRDNLSIEIILEISAFIADEIVVKGVRATSSMPVAHTGLSSEMIRKANTGQDLPYLLSMVPSLVETSESGTGIGYTSFRLRGSDPSRINVTLDGIPLNDAESQQVFWVDLPDLAASVSDIQIQRGVGTSTNGAGAFGGSINMRTGNPSNTPYAELGSTVGSFNTYKVTASVGTGLIKEKFKMDMRFSGITTDGYIDRSGADHRSFFISGLYNMKKSRLKANFIYGEEVTGISWWGVPEDSLATNRTYNPAGEYIDGFGNLSYYNDQSDNYVQTHFHLIYNRQINDNLYLNTAGHFTIGSGYYEQYKEDEPLADYGLPSWVFPGVVEIQETDLIRRKWMDNYFTGVIFNLLYNSNRIEASFGGGVNRYIGDHFGRLIWMRVAGWTEKNYQWYLNGAQKDEFNVYGKINYKLTDRINVYGDLQYRHIYYNITGTDDDLRDLYLLKRFNFFNPKAGVFITINPNQNAYISLGIANREPTRANYKDASGDDDATPMPETLYDIEGGYSIKLSKFHTGVNLYYMIYDDQLVPTGKLSNVGYPIMTNVEDSYRAGVELTSGVKPFEFLAWSGSITLSRNRIKNFTEYALNYDTADWSSEEISKEHGDVEIAYSPPVIMSSDLELSPFNSVAVHFISKYVARQYFDNTQNESRKINPYFVNSLRFDYRIGLRQIEQVNLQLQVNNIFNLQYESNAYGGNWYEDGIEYTWAYYFPQAGINYLLRISFLF